MISATTNSLLFRFPKNTAHITIIFTVINSQLQLSFTVFITNIP